MSGLLRTIVPALCCLATACSSNGESPNEVAAPTATGEPRTTGSPDEGPETSSALADVVGVAVSGSEGAYTFAVTIESPDIGCAQYANWWELLSPEAELLHRRILGHSHPDEQPFTRSSGPVSISADAPLVVRAHMHPGGYGGVVFAGSVASGFERASPQPGGFPPELESAAPQPTDCAF